jgi:L-asparaginase/Glu-tRNA(Gln) amidotransferase subunit D
VPKYAIYEYEPLIDSSEIEPTDWINIATDIERNYQSFDGFISPEGGAEHKNSSP